MRPETQHRPECARLSIATQDATRYLADFSLMLNMQDQDSAATESRPARDIALPALIGTKALTVRRSDSIVSDFIIKQPRDATKLAPCLSTGLSYHQKTVSQASSSKISNKTSGAGD